MRPCIRKAACPLGLDWDEACLGLCPGGKWARNVACPERKSTYSGSTCYFSRALTVTLGTKKATFIYCRRWSWYQHGSHSCSGPGGSRGITHHQVGPDWPGTHSGRLCGWRLTTISARGSPDWRSFSGFYWWRNSCGHWWRRSNTEITYCCKAFVSILCIVPVIGVHTLCS